MIAGGHDQCCNALGAGISDGGKAIDGIGTFECIAPVYDTVPDKETMLAIGLNVEHHVLKGLYLSFLYNQAGSLSDNLAVLFSAKDTDGDGMPDGWENYYGLDPDNDDANEDPDSDWLNNIEELYANTFPNDPDSDDDGLSDWDEVEVYGTDPRDDVDEYTLPAISIAEEEEDEDLKYLDMIGEDTWGDETIEESKSEDDSILGIDCFIITAATNVSGTWALLLFPAIVLLNYLRKKNR